MALLVNPLFSYRTADRASWSIPSTTSPCWRSHSPSFCRACGSCGMVWTFFDRVARSSTSLGVKIFLKKLNSDPLLVPRRRGPEQPAPARSLLLQETRPQAPLGEIGILHHLPVKLDRRLDPLDPELPERPAHPHDGLVPVVPDDDQLPEEGIVGRGDRVAGEDR